MVSIRDTLDIIRRLLLAPPCLATRKRLFLQSRWTRTMAVAITCTGRLGTGFKISPRAIGSKRFGPALRAEQSEPAGTSPAGFFVCFVCALDPARDCRRDNAWSTFEGQSAVRPSRRRLAPSCAEFRRMIGIPSEGNVLCRRQILHLNLLDLAVEFERRFVVIVERDRRSQRYADVEAVIGRK